MFNKQKAFTLIELLVTVSLVGILLTLAVPGLTRLLTNNSSASLGEELVDALNVARSEAIHLGRRVSICHSTTNGNGCAAAADWSDGFIIYVDQFTEDFPSTYQTGVASDSAGSPWILHRWQQKNNSVINVRRADTANANALFGPVLQFASFTSSGTLVRPRTETHGLRIWAGASGCVDNAARVINVSLSGAISVGPLSCTTAGM